MAPRAWSLVPLILLALPAEAGHPPQSLSSPEAAVEALLAADRAFSAASAGTDLVTGLSAMLAAEVVMPLPGGRFAEGKAQVVAALRERPENLKSSATWVPVRGGISADGLHGFTFGYLTVRAADGSESPGKYLAYWIKGAEGWRVAAYKRRPRAPGPVPLTLLAPSLPARILPPGAAGEPLEALGAGLAAAERAFSDEAQKIGLGPAFARYGTADAMNMGGPTDAAFVLGHEAIAKAVGGEGPATGSPVHWGADRVFVAASGDLGVTFGRIRQNGAAASDGGIAFFTVWRRASVRDPWRYIAE